MKRTQGTTLLELLTTLSIAAIVASLAAPAMSDFYSRQQLRRGTQALYQALTTTRATAVHRATTVSLSNNDGNWATGMTLFVDDNRNGSLDAGELVLRQFPAAEALSIRGNRWVANYVSYRPDGSAHTANGAFQVGTISLCHPDRLDEHRLVISIGGRVRREQSGNTPCL